MSDEWKANCEWRPTDSVSFYPDRGGVMLIQINDCNPSTKAGVSLSPASCRSLCAWLVARGFGAEDVREPEPDPICAQGMRANLDAAQRRRIDDLNERLGYLDNWSVRMDRVVSLSPPINEPTLKEVLR